jgi:chorismate-pyruvate lyase
LSGSSPVKLDVASLAELFYPTLDSLGEFVEVDSAAMPDVYRQLLAHEHHMTVTVESHHGCPVDVVVLDEHAGDADYARKILLTRTSDGRVVQFGIVRIHWQYVSADVRRDIESQATPLGRILIAHDVMRRIHVASLYRVAPSDRLAHMMRLTEPQATYGRTAMIYCDDQPAIELLEIVAPKDV